MNQSKSKETHIKKQPLKLKQSSSSMLKDSGPSGHQLMKQKSIKMRGGSSGIEHIDLLQICIDNWLIETPAVFAAVLEDMVYPNNKAIDNNISVLKRHLTTANKMVDNDQSKSVFTKMFMSSTRKAEESERRDSILKLKSNIETLQKAKAQFFTERTEFANETCKKSMTLIDYYEPIKYIGDVKSYKVQTHKSAFGQTYCIFVLPVDTTEKPIPLVGTKIYPLIVDFLRNLVMSVSKDTHNQEGKIVKYDIFVIGYMQFPIYVVHTDSAPMILYRECPTQMDDSEKLVKLGVEVGKIADEKEKLTFRKHYFIPAIGFLNMGAVRSNEKYQVIDSTLKKLSLNVYQVEIKRLEEAESIYHHDKWVDGKLFLYLRSQRSKKIANILNISSITFNGLTRKHIILNMPTKNNTTNTTSFQIDGAVTKFFSKIYIMEPIKGEDLDAYLANYDDNDRCAVL